MTKDAIVDIATAQDLRSYLWTPDGMMPVGLGAVTMAHPEAAGRHQAMTYNFEFRYKGKVKKVQVVAEPDISRAEVEDTAAKAAENWMRELDQQEHKRPPTAEEKKQAGKILNDMNLKMQKRRASSNNRIYYRGLR